MVYATEQNIIDRYGVDELLLVSDRDGDGVADVNIVSTGLQDATEEIDSYLAARYALPLATVPGILTRTCVDLAMYYMSPTADALTEERTNRIEAARKWLMALSKGHVSLGITAPEPPTIPQSVQSSSANPTRVFTRTTMEGL